MTRTALALVAAALLAAPAAPAKPNEAKDLAAVTPDDVKRLKELAVAWRKSLS